MSFLFFNNQNKNDLSIINNRESPIGINYQCPSQYHHPNSHHHNQMMICRAVSPSSSQSLSSLVASPSPTQFYSLNNSLEHMNLSPITLEAFMDIFPFSIVFDSNMKICQIGSCLKVCFDEKK